MPRGNRTGPWGSGPMTGRGMGYCAGFPTPGFMQSGPGFGFGRGLGLGGGFGRGFGRGRGWGRAEYGMGYDPYFQAPEMTPPSPKEELSSLKQEAEYLRQEMEMISKRMEELKTKEKK